jgi:hypothetical protein
VKVVKKSLFRIGALLFAAALCSSLLGGSALAVNQSISMATDVTGAQLIADCSGGASAETWQVSLGIKVSSGSEQTVTFQDTEFWAKYGTASGGPGQIQNSVTVVDAGGFVAGTQIAPHETKTFTPTVRFSLPCDTKSGDIFAGLHLVGNDKQYSDGATFFGGNTPVPGGAAGVVTAALLIGAIGLVAQVAYRRRVVAGRS